MPVPNPVKTPTDQKNDTMPLSIRRLAQDDESGDAKHCLRTGIFMTWADKMALRVALLIAAAGFFVWVPAAIALKTVFDSSFNRYILLWTVEAELAIALPLWLGLRAIHGFMAIWSRRRAAHDAGPEVTVNEPPPVHSEMP